MILRVHSAVFHKGDKVLKEVGKLSLAVLIK